MSNTSLQRISGTVVRITRAPEFVCAVRIKIREQNSEHPLADKEKIVDKRNKCPKKSMKDGEGNAKSAKSS